MYVFEDPVLFKFAMFRFFFAVFIQKDWSSFYLLKLELSSKRTYSTFNSANFVMILAKVSSIPVQFTV